MTDIPVKIITESGYPLDFERKKAHKMIMKNIYVKNIILLSLLTGILQTTSFSPHPGFIRTIDATPDKKSTVRIQFFNIKYMVGPWDWTSRDSIYLWADMATGVSYAVNSFLSPSVGIHYKFDYRYEKNTSNLLDIFQFGETEFSNIELGLKLGFKKTSELSYGFYPYIEFPISGRKEGVTRLLSTGTINYGAILLLSYRYSPNWDIHLNLGGINWFQDSKHNASSNQVRFGFALNSKTGRLKPFIELTYDWFVYQDIRYKVNRELYGGSPLRLGAGILWETNRGLVFNTGGSLYLTSRRVDTQLPESLFVLPKEDISFEFTIGVSYTGKPEVKKRREKKLELKGTIAGEAYDKEDNSPLPASILLVELNERKIADKEGKFNFSDLPQGIFTIEVETPGYTPKRYRVKVIPGRVSSVEFALERKEKEVVKVFGNVREIITNLPKIANLYFEDGGVRSFLTDESGIFSVELTPGSYTVEVKSEGCLPLKTKFDILEGKPAQNIDIFVLSERSLDTTFTVHFQPGRNILEPYADTLMGILAKVLMLYPQLKLEISGHTDSRGSDEYNQRLSERRAEIAKEYLTRNYRIENDRILTIGYGETRPIAPNSTEEGRNKNRRLEFHILK